MSKKLSFGEEIFLEEECNLGEKDEAAIIPCIVCSLGMAAACAFLGCEVPVILAGGAAAGADLFAAATAAGMAV